MQSLLYINEQLPTRGYGLENHVLEWQPQRRQPTTGCMVYGTYALRYGSYHTIYHIATLLRFCLRRSRLGWWVRTPGFPSAPASLSSVLPRIKRDTIQSWSYTVFEEREQSNSTLYYYLRSIIILLYISSCPSLSTIYTYYYNQEGQNWAVRQIIASYANLNAWL